MGGGASAVAEVAWALVAAAALTESVACFVASSPSKSRKSMGHGAKVGEEEHALGRLKVARPKERRQARAVPRCVGRIRSRAQKKVQRGGVSQEAGECRKKHHAARA